jgi:hypothetical protein
MHRRNDQHRVHSRKPRRSGIETHVVDLTTLTLRIKAWHLKTIRGLGMNDHTFGDNAVNALRKASMVESSKLKTLESGFSLAELCLAGILKHEGCKTLLEGYPEMKGEKTHI